MRKTYDTVLLRYLLRSVPPDERDYAEFALHWVTAQAVNPFLAVAIAAQRAAS